MAALAHQPAAASLLQSFPFRAALLALCIALLPLLPTQAPEAHAAAGAGQAFVAKAWELVHLLVVGIAVSYGLFSRKNDAPAAADDGRLFAPENNNKEQQVDANKPADARYVSRMFRDSLAPFDDDEYDVLSGGGKLRAWSAVHRPDEPVVLVANGGNGRGGVSDTQQQKPFSLPVRTLKPQQASSEHETVLPSPIPWRSRSGRFDSARPAPPSPTPRSPRRISPASSSSRETLAKATEEYYSNSKRRSPHRSSSSAVGSSSQPPAPPPPPPPFLVHGYHPAFERRSHAAAAKSFKEELQDRRMRGRVGGTTDHFSLDRSGSFNSASYDNNTNYSPMKPRSSFDSGSSSCSSVSVGKSVRTLRAREPPVFQGQSQDPVPEEVGDGHDAAQEVLGPEEPYGYRAYQSIPRFQYERSVSDPILGGVTVSSDETESSDDDEGGGGGGYSTSESTPEVDENEVDKKAEEFIARFREQIRRQRIESIKRSAGPRGVKHAK